MPYADNSCPHYRLINIHPFPELKFTGDIRHPPTWPDATREANATIQNLSNSRRPSYPSMASVTSNSSKQQDLVICNICGEAYDDADHEAKFLSCHHTFCSRCLDKLSHKGNVKLANIQCPNCRSKTCVPKNGIDGLQTNFYITRFKEYFEPTETCERLKSAPNVIGCHGHNSQPLSYFCVTCGIAICADCKTVDHQSTAGHSVVSISEAETAQLEELNVNQNTLNLNNRNLKIIETEMALLAPAKDTAITDMENCLAMMHEQLEQRKNDLMNCILDQFKAKQTALLDKQKKIQEVNEALKENITKAKLITTNGDFSQLKCINESLKKVKEESVSLGLDLGQNYLAFDSLKGMNAFKKSLCNVGKIYSKGFLPSTFAFRKGNAIAGHTTTYRVEIQSHHGEAVSVSSCHFSVQVTDSSDTELCTVLNTSGAECTMTFTPQMSGLHKVSGTFLGQQLISELTHISVHSNNPVLKFGDYGDGKGTFAWPWGIAIDNNNCLFVADSENHLIQKFTVDGKFLKQFSLAVHDKDHTTCDIAVDFNKNLILCPQILRKDDQLLTGTKILVFTFEGKLKNTINLSDEWAAFNIAIDGQGNIILSNLGKNCLFKVDKEGNFLDVIGPSIFSAHIAISDDGTIIVPDEHDDCVYVLNEDGTVKHRFGFSGTGKGQLKRPCGVATDNEYILVSEVGNNRVQVFKCDGTFAAMIESLEDPLVSPCGLAVTKDGHVYVVDAGNHCVKKFKYRDMPW